MLINKLQAPNISIIRKNINSALLELTNFFTKVRHVEPVQSETEFFRFILKKAIFWNYILSHEKESRLRSSMEQLVSDLIDLLKYFIDGDTRSLLLISRSLIENYIRLIEDINLEDDHITLNVLNDFKNDFPSEVISVDSYSQIKGLYSEASTAIHAGYLTSDISGLITNHLYPKVFTLKDENKLFASHKRVIISLEQCFVFKYPEKVFITFYREFNILEYLTNKKTRKAVLNTFENL